MKRIFLYLSFFLVFVGCDKSLPEEVDKKNIVLIIFSSNNWDDNQQSPFHEDTVALLHNSYKFLHCIVIEKDQPRMAARVSSNPDMRYSWYKNGTLVGNGMLADIIVIKNGTASLESWDGLSVDVQAGDKIKARFFSGDEYSHVDVIGETFIAIQ